jgi:hypothetical protein
MKDVDWKMQEDEGYTWQGDWVLVCMLPGGVGREASQEDVDCIASVPYVDTWEEELGLS